MNQTRCLAVCLCMPAGLSGVDCARVTHWPHSGDKEGIHPGNTAAVHGQDLSQCKAMQAASPAFTHRQS